MNKCVVYLFIFSSFFSLLNFSFKIKKLFSEHLSESFSLMTIKYYTIQKFVDQLKTLRKYTNGIDNFGNFASNDTIYIKVNNE